MDSGNQSVVYSEDGKTLLLVKDRHALRFDIPQGVETIGSNAFVYCKEIVGVSIPDSVKEIGDHAFSGCRSLESVSIPASVICIGVDCFKDCDRLKAVHVDAENQVYASFDGVLFDKDFTMLLRYPAGKSDTHYDVPEGIVQVGWGAFCGNRALEAVHIPSSVLLITDEAFCGCKSLERVGFEDGLVTIADFAFMDCGSLRDLEFPSTLRTIGACAFSGCKRLRSVELPQGLVNLLSYSFCRCERLREVRIPATARKIEDSIFDGCIWLLNIYCEVAAPDDMKVGSFFSDEEDMAGRTLHVPARSVVLYRTHPLFGRFSKIEPI